MHPSDLNSMREDLMTPEELEEYTHDPSSERIPTYTPTLRAWLIEDWERASPEAATRRKFERRPPALGATPELLQELLDHYPRLPPVQQRMLVQHVRSAMLRHLISCDGAETLQDLVKILQDEIDSGIPAPIPEWYKFSTVTMGPRKIGYDSCSNRGCFRTETVDKQFAKCSKCKVPMYCSRECQTADWKARHKKLCKEAAKERDMFKDVGRMMQGLSDLSMTGQFDTNADLREQVHTARQNPAVRERRRQLRAEKKRPKGSAPEGPEPDFF